MEYRRDDRDGGRNDETQVYHAVYKLDDYEAAHYGSEETERERQRHGEIRYDIYRVTEVAFGSAEQPFFAQTAVIDDEERGKTESKAGIDACESRSYTEKLHKRGQADEYRGCGDIRTDETRLPLKGRSGLVEIPYQSFEQ